MDIEHKIYFLRGRRAMLDRDLAQLYGVETKALNQAVKRNIKRFPQDFMFQLTKEEEESLRFHFGTSKNSSRFQIGTLNEVGGLDKPDLKSQFATSKAEKPLRSQFVTSKPGRGGVRYPSYAFTEQGVAMLSSVLNSDRAIQANIQIMRTFTKIREMLVTNDELRQKIEKLEEKYDQNFSIVFKAIKQLISEDKEPKKIIGFRTD